MIAFVKGVVRLLVVATVTVMVISLAYLAGFMTQYLAVIEAGPQQPAPPGQAAAATPVQPAHPSFAVLQEALDIVAQHYYGELPPDNEIEYGAIRGSLEVLGDAHTVFVNPVEARRFKEDLNGSFEGIGATIEKRDDRILIVAPLPNTPAERAGLRAGDVILKVDGESLAGADLWEVITKIRGPRGEPVTLTILRADRPAPFDVVIRRDKIDIPIVTSRVIQKDGHTIGYIRLFSFTSNAPKEFRKQLRQLLQSTPEGVILDLRDNPGGYLHAAVQIASEFVDGLILVERGKDGPRNHPSIAGGLMVENPLPLVVLVNRGSASASEIVAGAIQDHQRGILVGETTFGKGSVQISRDLSDGSNLRVTIARWFTPAGRQIHGQGLAPDIDVEITEEQQEAGMDPVLERAILYLIQPNP